ncbi:MAG: flap endonuclease-1 [Euryarchaeota archaeon]|nr:flap endonuclease-1 [Euryarchaeota archaeon]
MGVDLSGIVEFRPVKLEELSNRVVAIDAFNSLYQFLASIRGPDGTPLKDSHGRVTSHLSGLFYRTANLVENGIKPVYVFDGPAHPLKARTLAERKARKVKAAAEMEEALAAGDLERARSKAAQTSVLSRDMSAEARTLLAAMGVPVVEAPGEGEALAANLAKDGLAWTAASQDYDSLLCGAPRLLRNLTLSGRRKLPGRQAWTDVSPEIVEAAPLLKALGVTREQLIDVALLCGTDFNEGVHGYGAKKALKAVTQGKNVTDLLKGDIEKETVQEIRAIFLSPQEWDKTTFEWKAVDEAKVVDILVNEHAFNEERVRGTVGKMTAAAGKKPQKSLDAFFS